MIILPEQDLVFVAVPRTGSMSMSQWLERAFRSDNHMQFPVESLHDWHANLAEAVEVSGFPLRRMWSFCVVRNPFDRLVSSCAALEPRFLDDPGYWIRQALNSEFNRWTQPQTYFTEDVSKVYRFENLNQAVGELRDRFDIPSDVEFRHEHETEHEHYRAYFDDSMKKVAMERYASDFEAFGYKF